MGLAIARLTVAVVQSWQVLGRCGAVPSPDASAGSKRRRGGGGQHVSDLAKVSVPAHAAAEAACMRNLACGAHDVVRPADECHGNVSPAMLALSTVQAAHRLSLGSGRTVHCVLATLTPCWALAACEARCNVGCAGSGMRSPHAVAGSKAAGREGCHFPAALQVAAVGHCCARSLQFYAGAPCLPACAQWL